MEDHDPIEDDLADPGQSPERRPVLEALHVANVIFWFVLILVGLNQQWLRKMPFVGLLVIFFGLLVSREFLLEYVRVNFGVMNGFMRDKAKTSNAALLFYIAFSALLGGAVGWMLMIRAHTTETVAACAAAFGATLVGLIVYLGISAQRVNQQSPDEDRNE